MSDKMLFLMSPVMLSMAAHANVPNTIPNFSVTSKKLK